MAVRRGYFPPAMTAPTPFSGLRGLLVVVSGLGAVALSDGRRTRPLSALHQTASASSAKAADS
jgi:hypothetical protein